MITSPRSSALETAVYVVGELPEALLKGLLCETPEQRQVFEQYVFFYQSQRLWLTHFLLGENLPPECKNTDFKFFEPHARMKAALFRLILGLYERSELLQSTLQGQGAAAVFWRSAIQAKCSDALSGSGLTGPPSLFSKRQLYDDNNELLKNSLDLLSSDDQAQARAWDDCPVTFLYDLACQVGRGDIDFFKDYLMPFKKAVSRGDRQILNCRELQSGCLLNDGTLFLTGTSNRFPNLTGKGFAAKSSKRGNCNGL
jgi:hypothetical protein